MVARAPQNGYNPHQANGRANGVGNGKYLHLKDLQAKAEMEAKDLGAQTPVRPFVPALRTCY